MPNKRILDTINSPADLKLLHSKDIAPLCSEIRKEIIDTVSNNGGHLASNLGSVELTVALHRIFNSPDDRIIFDVGHQSYTHKILTGRRDAFNTIRTENGISGFTRPEESEHDIFVSGHSSTSISAALGIARANAIKGSKNYTIAVIGDGALSGGLAFEAINNINNDKRLKFIVILNDNKMSISKNVGSMARHLAVMRSSSTYFDVKRGIDKILTHIPLIGKYIRSFVFKLKKAFKNIIYHSNFFEDMGFMYFGPIDGHDSEVLEMALTTAKKVRGPVLIHVNTIKGKGYTFAEENPANYHGVSKMDIDTGEQAPSKTSFSAVAGNTLCNLAQNDQRVCSITAAMCTGTGLDEFYHRFPNRFFDVGIAEGHAVTFCSGLSKAGMIPYFAVYSSFLQRAYDELVHDISIQNLKVVLLIDRAGFVGMDGETHHGLLDVSFLTSIPSSEIYSPTYFVELEHDIQYANSTTNENIIAIRYPRAGEIESKPDRIDINSDYSLLTSKTNNNLIISYGRVFSESYKAYAKLNNEGIDTSILKLNKIWPISNELVYKIKNYNNIYFIEEGVKNGGICEHMLRLLTENGFKGKYNICAVDNEYVKAMKTDSFLKKYSLDCDSIYSLVKSNE